MLIQVGGLGLVTLTSFFALAARRRMGFRDLRLLGESVSADGLSKATEVLKIVIKLAAAFEAVGIVLLLFIIFHLLDQPTDFSYNGKYQDQEAGPQVAR
jgi:trk system potassium uptake protein TrkH